MVSLSCFPLAKVQGNRNIRSKVTDTEREHNSTKPTLFKNIIIHALACLIKVGLPCTVYAKLVMKKLLYFQLH